MSPVQSIDMLRLIRNRIEKKRFALVRKPLQQACKNIVRFAIVTDPSWESCLHSRVHVLQRITHRTVGLLGNAAVKRRHAAIT